MNNMYRILIDTNIITHLFASDKSSLEHQIRGKLTHKLLENPKVQIILYKEQVKTEIPRAIDNLLITRLITRPDKYELIGTIVRNYKETIRNGIETGKIRIIKKRQKLVARAATLFRIITQQYKRQERKRLENMGFDLILLTVAEKLSAAFLTRDNMLYIVYKNTLREKTNIPAVYYLEIDTNNKISYYKICGQRIEPLEIALKETCKELNITYKEPLIEC